MKTLEVRCADALSARWSLLSDESKQLLLSTPNGVDFFKMLWERQFYYEECKRLLDDPFYDDPDYDDQGNLKVIRE